MNKYMGLVLAFLVFGSLAIADDIEDFNLSREQIRVQTQQRLHDGIGDGAKTQTQQKKSLQQKEGAEVKEKVKNQSKLQLLQGLGKEARQKTKICVKQQDSKKNSTQAGRRRGK